MCRLLSSLPARASIPMETRPLPYRSRVMCHDSPSLWRCNCRYFAPAKQADPPSDIDLDVEQGERPLASPAQAAVLEELKVSLRALRRAFTESEIDFSFARLVILVSDPRQLRREVAEAASKV